MDDSIFALTEEVEVSLFLNDSLAVSAFLHACKDELIRACSAQISDLERRSSTVSSAAGGGGSRFVSDSGSRRTRSAVTEILQLVDDEDQDEDDNDENANDTNQHDKLQSLEDHAADHPNDPDLMPLEHAGVSLYHSLYSKRVCVLKQLLQSTREDIHHASTRSIGAAARSSDPLSRVTLIGLNTIPTTAASSSSAGTIGFASSNSIVGIPPLLRFGILALFPLIDSVSQNDTQLKRRTIQILVDILQTSPPLSLANESEDTIDQMMRLIKPTSEDKESSTPVDGAVLSALIGLSLQRGSLRHILSSLLPLVDAAPAATAAALDVHPYLRTLEQHHRSIQVLSVLSEDAYVTSWKHHPLTLRTIAQPSTLVSPSMSQASTAAAAWSNRPLSSLLSHYSTLAADGTYLYLHSSSGLFKVGTGFGGTLQGHIYGWNSSFVGGDLYKGWMVHAHGAIWFRKNMNGMREGYVATRIDARTLQEVGELCLEPEQLRAFGGPNANQENIQIPESTNNNASGGPQWFHLTSDGNFLYLLRLVDPDSSQYAVSVIDPSHAASTPPTGGSSSCRILYESILPGGFTSLFSLSTRKSQSVDSLVCPYHFYPGQKVDAKDSINKWCIAVVLQVTTSRVFVHYEGWSAKYDEWFPIESNRLAKRGEYTDRDSAAAKDKAATAGSTSARIKFDTPSTSGLVEWSFRTTGYALTNSEPQPILDASSVASSAGDSASDGWTTHSVLHSDQLESAFLAHSLTSPEPFLLKTHRREYGIYLSRMVQVDLLTHEVLQLRRQVIEPSGVGIGATLEDMIMYTTGKQIVCAMPPKTNAKGVVQEPPIMRVFDLAPPPIALTDDNGVYHPPALVKMLTHGLVTSSTSAVPSSSCCSSLTVPARWLGDRSLLSLSCLRASATPATSGPSVNPAQLLHAQVSAICWDGTNQTIWTYTQEEMKLCRFENLGPHANNKINEQKQPIAKTLSHGERKEMESKCDDEVTSSGSASLPYSIAARVLSSLVLSVSRVSSSSSPSFSPPPSPSLVSSSATFHPFSIDVHPATFARLTLMLTRVLTLVSLESNRVGASHADDLSNLIDILSHTVTLLEANLRQFVEYARGATSAEVNAIQQHMPQLVTLLEDLAQFTLKASTTVPPSRLAHLHRASQSCIRVAIKYLYPTASSLSTMIVRRLEFGSTSTSSGLLTSDAFIRHHADTLLELLLDNASSHATQHLTILFRHDTPQYVQNVLLAALTTVYTQSRALVQSMLDHHSEVTHIREAIVIPPPSEDAHPSITSAVPILLTSAMRLLLRLQRNLFSLVDGELSHGDGGVGGRMWFGVLDLYVEQVYALSGSILRFAHDECVKLGFGRSAMQFRQSLTEHLQCTMVGILLPAVTAFIGSLSMQGTGVLHDSIRQSLSCIGTSSGALDRVLHETDRWNVLAGLSSSQLVGAPINTQVNHPPPIGSGVGITASSATSTASSLLASNLEFQHLTLETSHPYVPETLDRTITIRGAVGIMLQFDPRSSSRNSNETLKVSQSCWQVLCSGVSHASVARIAADASASGSASAAAAATHASAHSKWPSTIRRPGDSVQIFWQVERKEKSDASDKDKSLAEKELDFGFKLTIHGFVPHASPRCVSSAGCSSSSLPSRISWPLDVELGLATMVGLLAKPTATIQHADTNNNTGAAQSERQPINPTHASHPLSPLATLFAAACTGGKHGSAHATTTLSMTSPVSDSILDLIDSDAAELSESAIDSAVDMEVVSMGVASVVDGGSSSSSSSLLSKEDLLLRDLLEQEAGPPMPISLPNSPERANSNLLTPTRNTSIKTPSPTMPYSRVLIDWMSARLSGRPAMNANMKRLMQPCESKLLGMFLSHSQLLSQAADLLSLIHEEGSLDVTPLHTPAGSPALGPSTPMAAATIAAHLPHSHTMPSMPSSPALVPSTSQIRRRAMTPQQTLLFNQIKPIWLAVYKLEQWILNQSQLANKFNLFLDETRFESPPIDSLTSFSVDSASAPTAASKAHSSSDAFIASKLSQLTPDTVKQFCDRMIVDFHPDNIEFSIKKLSAKIALLQSRHTELEKIRQQRDNEDTLPSAIDTIVRSPSTIATGGNSGLDYLTRKINGIAQFLAEFRPNPFLLQQVGISTLLTKLSSFVLNVTHPSFHVASLRRFVASRQNRVTQRTHAYRTLSGVLTSVTITCVKETLLTCIPPSYYSASLKGCTNTSSEALRTAFTHFLQQIIKITPTNNADASTSDNPTQSMASLPPLSLLKSILLYADLPFDPLHDSPLLSQVSLLTFLSTLSKQSIAAMHAFHTHGPLNTLTTCEFAFTGSTFADMEVWECITCGLVNGSLCCRVCARTCHAGHDVHFKHRSNAFCDCGLNAAANAPCKAMAHLPDRRQKRTMQKLATRAMSAYQKFALKCLSWDADGDANPQVTALHALIFSTILRSTIHESRDLYGSSAASLASMRMASHVGPMHADTAAKLDESFLHHLLVLALKARKKMVRFIQTVCDKQPADESAILMVMEYINALLDILYSSSTRLQRIAIRLLKHTLPILPIRLVDAHASTFTCLTLLRSPITSSSDSASASSATSTAVSIIGGLISFIGDLLLSTSAQGHNLSSAPTSQPAGGAAQCELLDPNPIESGQADDSKSDLTLYQTILHLSDVTGFDDANPASPSSTPVAPSAQAMVSAFIERHSADVLELQRLQVAAEARANGESKNPAGDDDRMPIGKKLDSIFANEVRTALESRGEAAVFTGGWERCSALAKKVAGQGLVCSLRLLEPEPHALLNAKRMQRAAWTSCQFGGRQTLDIGAELVTLVRQFVQTKPTGEWATTTQRTIGIMMHHLDTGIEGIMSPQRDSLQSPSSHLLSYNSPVPSAFSLPFLGAFGCVLLVGGLGLDVPRVGGPTALTMKETGGEGHAVQTETSIEGGKTGIEGDNQTQSTNNSNTMTVPNVNPLTLNSPWRTGHVLHVDDGSSEVLVCLDDDPRRAISRVHTSKLRAGTPTHEIEFTWILSLTPTAAIDITKRLLHTISLVRDRSAAFATLPSENRWVLSLLETRLIRSLCVVARRPECASLLLTAQQAPTFQWIISKAFMPFFSDYRTVAFDWSRIMERLIDLRLAARRAASGDPFAFDVAGPNDSHPHPTAFHTTKATFCTLQDHGLTLEYHGGVDAPIHARVSIRRIKKQDIMPATFIADQPYQQLARDSPTLLSPSTEPIVYFEIDILDADPRGMSIGWCPDSDVLRHRRLHGWCEGSYLIDHRGRKGVFRKAARDPATDKIRVGDLLDVRDSVKKWEPAQVIAVAEKNAAYQDVKIHYVDWDVRYDETISIPMPYSGKTNERVAPFGTHTKVYPIGQIFSDPYASDLADLDPLQSGDTIGCGWDRFSHTIFFTLNNRHLGTAFTLPSGELPQRLFPAVCLESPGAKVQANFGARPWRFTEFKQMQAKAVETMIQHTRAAENAAAASLASSALHSFDSNSLLASSESGSVLVPRGASPSSASASGASTPTAIPVMSDIDLSRLASRREKALSIMHVGVLPDYTLEQVLHALEVCDDDVERAVGYAYEHPQAFASGPSATLAAGATGNNTPSRDPRSPPRSPSPTAAFTQMMGDSSSSSNIRSPSRRTRPPLFIGRGTRPTRVIVGVDSLSSSDADEPASSSVPVDEDERKNGVHTVRFSIDGDPDERLAQSPTPFTGSPRRARNTAGGATSAQAAANQEEDALLLHSFQHNALSGAHSTNDYIVAEAQDLASATSESRSRSFFDSSDLFGSLGGGGSSRAGGLGGGLGLARTIDRAQITDLIAQLQQIDQGSMSSVMMLLADILPVVSESRFAGAASQPQGSIILIPSSSADVFNGGGGSSSSVEPRFRGDELVPGLRVRVGRDAKKSILRAPGALSSPNVNPWSATMEHIVGTVGVITQLDRVKSIALVEFTDVERSRKRAFWLPIRVLSKIVTVRTNAHIGLNHAAVIQPHLAELQTKSTRHHARQFLQVMVTALSTLIKNAESSCAQSTAAVTGASSSTALIATPHTSDSSTSSPFLKLHFPQYIRDILTVTSVRCLQKALYDNNYMSFLLPSSKVDTQVAALSPADRLARAAMSQEEPLQHLLRYVARQQPQLGISALQHTYKLLRDESRVFSYENNDLQPKDYMVGGKAISRQAHAAAMAGDSDSTSSASAVPARPASNTSKIQMPILWSRTISVPNATCLGVTFQGKVCLPAGVALQFYGNVQCTRLMYAFSGPKGSHAQPVALPPFVVSTNNLWLQLTFNPELSSVSALPLSMAPYDTKVFFTFHVAPISEQFSSACILTHTLTEQYVQARREAEQQHDTTPVTRTGAASATEPNRLEVAHSPQLPSSPSSLGPSKTEADFLLPLIKRIFTECAALLLLNSVSSSSVVSLPVSSSRVKPPVLVRTHMAKLLCRLVSIVPRGALGDLAILTTINQELQTLHRIENKAATKLHERDQESGGEASPANVLYSTLFQSLLELMIAVKTYGAPLLKRVIPTQPLVPLVRHASPSDSKSSFDVDEMELLTTSASATTAATALPLSPFKDNTPPELPEEEEETMREIDTEIEEDIQHEIGGLDRSGSASRDEPPKTSSASVSSSSSLSPTAIHSPDSDSFELDNMSNLGSGRWARMRDGLAGLEQIRAMAHRLQRRADAASASVAANMSDIDAQMANVTPHPREVFSPRPPRRRCDSDDEDNTDTTTMTANGMLHIEFAAMPEYVNDVFAVVRQLRAIHAASLASDPSSVASSTLHLCWQLPSRHLAYTRAGGNVSGGVSAGISSGPTRSLSANSSPRVMPSAPPAVTTATSDSPDTTPVNKALWSVKAYEQLTQLVNDLSDSLNIAAHQLSPSSLPPLSSLPHLVRLACGNSRSTLSFHVEQLQHLNMLIFDNLTKIDLTNIGGIGQTWRLTNEALLPPIDTHLDGIMQLTIVELIERSHGLLFLSTKSACFHALLQETALSASGAAPGLSSLTLPTVRINRLRASEVYDRAVAAKLHRDRRLDLTATLRDTLFGQVSSQLRGVNCAAFRRPRPRGATPHVAFQVVMEGESVLGQAGPYRILFQELCEELQECKGYRDTFPLSLFVPTPNGLHGVGENRGAFVPNPSATHAQALEAYEFFGRLLGIALRTKVLLSLSFPLLFWQILSGREPTRAALREVDQTLVDSILIPIEACKSEEEFQRKFGYESIDADEAMGAAATSNGGAGEVTSVLHFPVTRSDGTIPAPLAHGGTIPVTYASCKLYAQQLEATRLYESIQQIQAIRRGMGDLLPPQLLSIFSPSELSLLACGRNEIDIPMLRRHTEYSAGLTDSTPHIEWFWNILANDFDQKQKAKFVKFAYAQERLPANDAGYEAYPKIRMLIKPSAVAADKQDDVLPHAETCFFNLQLPAYSSYAIMKERLLTTLATVDYLMSGDDGLHAAPPPLPPSLAAVPPPSAPSGSAASRPVMATSSPRAPQPQPPQSQSSARNFVVFGSPQSGNATSSSTAPAAASSSTPNVTSSFSFRSLYSDRPASRPNADRATILDSFHAANTAPNNASSVAASSSAGASHSGPTSSSSHPSPSPSVMSSSVGAGFRAPQFPHPSSRAFAHAFAGGPASFANLASNTTGSNGGAPSSSPTIPTSASIEAFARTLDEWDEEEESTAASSNRASTSSVPRLPPVSFSSAMLQRMLDPANSSSSSADPFGLFGSGSEADESTESEEDTRLD